MKIISAEFIKSCSAPEQFPQDRLPEVAFVGRSNVGKSSLINSLLSRKALVKVSRTPGKTQLLNWFRVATGDPLLSPFYIVDLPGYGYAKVAKAVRAQWRPMIEGYLTGNAISRSVVLLVEGRGVGESDLITVEWLRAAGQVPIVVATKVDKLRQQERHGLVARLREALGLPDPAPVVAYSSVTHEGRDALWGVLRERLRT
jgi:GTP-binding protein